MRFPDLLMMSINNLRRRKLRTVLTVLGVVIGTASIVVMVSLGIGLNELNMELIASSGSLTTISVYSPSRYGMSADGAAASQDAEPNYITDEEIKAFSRLDHVKEVSPVLTVNVLARQGAYEAQYLSLVGVSQYFLSQIPLAWGEPPREGETGLVVGNTVLQQFSNAKTGDMYWQTGKLPEVDFKGKPLFVIFDMDAYYQSQGGSSAEDGTKTLPPKKYLMNAVAMVEGGQEDWNTYSSSLYTDIEGMKSQLKKVFRGGKAIPGQPTNKKGKPYSYFIYDSAQVFVDDMDHVTQVQKELADMGFQVSSQMDWLESSQKQSNIAQAVLGGIGAVSLFVAAIGIANTMMMSIYERTKEIGVMKVLGCDMGNIRNMFLIESGFIGFMGGLAGLGLSLGISAVINHFVSGEMLVGVPGNLSRIPVWLALAAVGFAVLVGMAAGFMPAMRAMGLSPLAAIRNE